jgi:glutamate dehydrogenase
LALGSVELDCDILIPAALENQITEENAGCGKAKILAEAAMDRRLRAAEILLRKGVLVIPDITERGGVTVSYFSG